MPNINTGAKLVLAFITLLIGVVLIGSIATEQENRVNKIEITDETHDLESIYYVISTGEVNETGTQNEITVTNYPTGWKSQDCQLTNVEVKNSTGTALTVTTDYTVDASTGIISILNTTATTTETFGGNIGKDNTSLISYDYCPDDYMSLGWGRTILKLPAGFFAIAILLSSVGLFFSVGKDYGVW